MFRLTPVVQTLILINVAMFAIPAILGSDALFQQLLALRFVNSGLFKPWELVTYMFMHAGFEHIFFNMLGVAVFGPMLEQVWGSQKFLFYYLACGIGAGLVYLGVNYIILNGMEAQAEAFITHPTPEGFANFLNQYAQSVYDGSIGFLNQYSASPSDSVMAEKAVRAVEQIYRSHVDSPMIGASGALYGIVLAFGMSFPNLKLILIFPPIPIKAKWLALGYGAMELYSVWRNAPDDNVAHLAHLGGMLAGIILLFIWSGGKRPEQYY